MAALELIVHYLIQIGLCPHILFYFEMRAVQLDKLKLSQTVLTTGLLYESLLKEINFRHPSLSYRLRLTVYVEHFQNLLRSSGILSPMGYVGVC